MFSTTTIASSTTNPIAIVSAINETLSMLKLRRYIAAKEPSSANGIVMLGMIVAQTLRKNRRMTMTTRPMVSASVNSTSRTEARMVILLFLRNVWATIIPSITIPLALLGSFAA